MTITPSIKEQVAELNALWTANISDPGPEEKQWYRWLYSFNFEVVRHAVNATINKYKRDPDAIDFVGCCKFTSATARRKAEETMPERSMPEINRYGVPQEWLQAT